MLENVAKITRVVLACGTVDLRKGIDGLSMIIGDSISKIRLKKELCSYSVGDVPTESKVSYGWAMDSFCCINGLKPVHYRGQELRKKLRISPKNNSIA